MKQAQNQLDENKWASNSCLIEMKCTLSHVDVTFVISLPVHEQIHGTMTWKLGDMSCHGGVTSVAS